MRKFYVIKCPKCGYEYLPEEIFYPKSFLGNAKNIVRDENGKILYFDEDSMNTKEEYICDNCDCAFDVDAKVEFSTKINVVKDFSEDYETSIYEEEITLEEPEESLNCKELW